MDASQSKPNATDENQGEPDQWEEEFYMHYPHISNRYLKFLQIS